MALLALITGGTLWGVGGYVSLRIELAKGDGMRASVRAMQAFVAEHRGAFWLGVLAAGLVILSVGRATLAAVAAFEMLPARLALVGPTSMALGAGLALRQRSAKGEV